MPIVYIMAEKERRGRCMKAIRIHEFGGPEVLRYEDIPEPKPGTDEIRVQVIAAGVNPMDW